MQCCHQSCAGCGETPCCTGCGQPKELRLHQREAAFLLRFAELPFLPVVRFALRRFGEPIQKNDNLAPVFILEASDTLETIEQTAAVLDRLAQLRLISISYTEPLGHFNYSEYVNSSAFTEFCAQASGFSVPEIEYGSMALTALGQEAIDDLELAVLPRAKIL
ncbi:MAG: DUF4393 domain-containing protein [Clostridiaceae bacterium]|nr:DUF4393 domain-containing protein [Clostridiaceae bacterium]